MAKKKELKPEKNLPVQAEEVKPEKKKVYKRKPKTSPATRSKVGAPSKYKPEYCEAMIDYFNYKDEDRYRIEVKVRYDKNGNPISEEEVRKPNSPPTLYGFAGSIGVSVDTLQEWRLNYPEFSAAYKRAKDAQANFIIANNMENIGNTAFSIFMMKNNHDWTDRVESKVETKMSLENLVGKSFKEEDE